MPSIHNTMDSSRQSNRAPAPSSEQTLRKEQYNSAYITHLEPHNIRTNSRKVPYRTSQPYPENQEIRPRTRGVKGSQSQTIQDEEDQASSRREVSQTACARAKYSRTTPGSIRKVSMSVSLLDYARQTTPRATRHHLRVHIRRQPVPCQPPQGQVMCSVPGSRLSRPP
jgi:hypothetical protein